MVYILVLTKHKLNFFNENKYMIIFLGEFKDHKVFVSTTKVNKYLKCEDSIIYYPTFNQKEKIMHISDNTKNNYSSEDLRHILMIQLIRSLEKNTLETEVYGELELVNVKDLYGYLMPLSDDLFEYVIIIQ